MNSVYQNLLRTIENSHVTHQTPNFISQWIIYGFNSEINLIFCGFAEAISCLLKAIEIYTDMGRFTMAAKHHQSIAEIYESEAVDLERAVHHYEQAADYFRGEESNSSANKCLLKVAQYAAQLENYDKAIQIYEQVMEIFPAVTNY